MQSHFSCVRFFAVLWTAVRQASLSMGFSRQEYWSGLPGPPPEDLPNPGIEPRSPALQVDSLPAESQEKPKNIGVGSLSLPQQIFPSQESNQGLLHCRWIFYQLSYQESPSQLKCHLLWGVSPDPLAWLSKSELGALYVLIVPWTYFFVALVKLLKCLCSFPYFFTRLRAP